MPFRWILVVGLALLGLLFAVPPLLDSVRNDEPAPAEVDPLRGLAELPFRAFVEESYRRLELRDPDTLISNELSQVYGVEERGRWSDRSPDYLEETYALEKRTLGMLHRRDREALSPEERSTYDVYEWYLADRVRWHDFANVDYCNNPYDLQSAVLDFLISFPIENAADAEAYAERLSTFGTWMDQVLEGFRLREEAGALPPRVLLRQALGAIDQFVPADDTGVRQATLSPLCESFRDRLEESGFTEPEVERWAAAAESDVARVVIPALDRLEACLIELQTRADDTLTAKRLREGEAFYAASLHHHTTSDWSPARIHERACAEVVRILEEMRTCAARLGWPENLTTAELDQRITEANAPIEGDALLPEYQRLIDRATAALPAYFARLPKAGLAIEVDPNTTFACYVAPALDGSKPGRMLTNLVSAVPYTAYDEPVLMHHETVPGHHLQIALAQELGLVNVQRDTITSVYDWHPSFQPYVEGWALYGEGLAAEMGLYDDDPLGNLCRLRLELQRTARSAVDTGIHAYGWTWEDAADYLETITGSPPRPSAALRYFTQPGQSCGYTLGMWTIRDARQRAMGQLGDAFNLQEFHRVVLEAGPMPLLLLDRRVDDWIAEQLVGAP